MSFESPHINKESELVSPEDASRAKEVESILNNLDIAPTARGAAALYLFNFYKNNPAPSPQEISSAFNKMKSLSDEEFEFSNQKNPLPTIGIELELPEDTLTQDKVAILKALKIENYREHLVDGLHEVNPHFAYNAAVPARIIQELVKLDILPLNENTEKIETVVPLSLHLNFGIPKDITQDFDKYRSQVYVLNDALIYAFTSASRLMNRKTKLSVDEKNNAKPSSKSGRVYAEGSTVLEYSTRLEMRANEFKDQSSFRMLFESQKLTGALFSYIRCHKKIPASFTEARLADLWKSFEAEAVEYFKSQQLVPNMIDTKDVVALKGIDDSELQKTCRSLVTKYAQEVDVILKEAKEAEVTK